MNSDNLGQDISTAGVETNGGGVTLQVSAKPLDKPAVKASRTNRKSGKVRDRTQRLTVVNLGPIPSADVRFGDLTVVVGQQATGKSLFLQTLKLLIDRNQIHDTFKHHSMTFNGNVSAFLDGYYGRGMAGAIADSTYVLWQGLKVDMKVQTQPSKAADRHERVFYIPAQRVMSLPGGVSQNFGQFNYGDPYSLRAFSDAVHDLIQNEFGAKGELFPAPNKLNATLRKPISEHLFGGNRLVIDDSDFTKKLALKVKGQSAPLGFLSWSAGQREFTPMLMGLYWLCAGPNRRKTGKTKDDAIEWVVIEEPEMGLHPQGIGAVLLLAQELLRRGYRVVISTHSPVVLDLVWALQEFRKHQGTEADVRKLLGLDSSPYAKELGRSALEKDYRVYYFSRGKAVQDISALSPAAVDLAESEWGGLVGFASKVGEVIAEVVSRDALQPKRRTRRVATPEVDAV
ncbi:MAG: hypothetical protein RL722_39 [Pseudomonadota bacterium]